VIVVESESEYVWPGLITMEIGTWPDLSMKIREVVTADVVVRYICGSVTE